MNIKFDFNIIMMRNQIKNPNKLRLVISFFIATVLIFTSLIVSNCAIAQPSNFNKQSKAEKCASGDLPPPACKKISEQNQASGSGPGTNMDGSGDVTGTGSFTTGSNLATSAINQDQQSTQSCATGNIKVLPHSSFTCTNTANQNQANNGSVSTDQTVIGGVTNQ
jgi:hypothetical protein